MEPTETGLFLSGLPLFRHAPADSLNRIAEVATHVDVPAREYVFAAQERASEVHVVLSGRLEIVAPDGAVMREVGPGSVLGELAVVTDSVRSAAVRARRDSELLSINGPRFQALLRSDAALAFALLRQLGVQLRESAELGGLPPAPAVFAVVPFLAEAELPRFWSGLVDAYADVGATAAYDRPPDDGRSLSRWLAHVEARHEHVVLLAAGSHEWRSFALRQADRVVVVAGASKPPQATDLAGVELVFAEPLPAADLAAWLAAFAPRAHHHAHAHDRGRAIRRAVRRMTGRGVGLVLSGGGARGGAHIGALEVLAERGYEIDHVGGCSIGALVGVMAARGWDAKRMRDVWVDELVRRSPFSDYTVPRVSLIRGYRAAAMLERIFGEVALEELPCAAFTVSADLITSELVVHRRGRAADAVAASMAIPGLVPPQRHGRRLLIDGGVLDNLPVDIMAAAREGPVIAVDVMRKPTPEQHDGRRAMPTIVETLTRATVLGSVERSERGRAQAALTIVPDVQAIALRDFGQLDRAVTAGRLAAEAALDAGGDDALRAALDG